MTYRGYTIVENEDGTYSIEHNGWKSMFRYENLPRAQSAVDYNIGEISHRMLTEALDHISNPAVYETIRTFLEQTKDQEIARAV